MLASNSEYRDMLNSLERAVGLAEAKGHTTVTADTKSMRMFIEVARKRAKMTGDGPVYVIDKREVEYDRTNDPDWYQ